MPWARCLMPLGLAPSGTSWRMKGLLLLVLARCTEQWTRAWLEHVVNVGQPVSLLREAGVSSEARGEATWSRLCSWEI